MADSARLELHHPAALGCVRRFLAVIFRFGIPLGLWTVHFGSWTVSAATNTSSSDDIPPLRPPRDLIPSTYWEQHSTAILLVFFVVLVLLLVLVLVLLRPKRPIILPPDIEARQALEQLRRNTEDGVVLSRVSQILRRYFAVAFQLPPEEMTTAEFCAAVTANSRIGPELSVPLIEFLRACDERKFSPTPKGPPTGSAVEQALKFVWLGQTRLKESSTCRADASAKADPAPVLSSASAEGGSRPQSPSPE